ncbi:hypothetical protein HYU19_03790 [Candidatus Woesearchaeota archaeon]|nr:hypothetical protein [Candidatus Woesearchaeota archaeon]
MDVDTLQKVNRLAKDLLQHGMAGDTDEALRMADSMVSKKKEFTQMTAQIRGTAVAGTTNSEPALVPADPPAASSSSTSSPSALSSDLHTGLKKELDKANDQIEKQRLAIAELQEYMKQVVDELNRLKSSPQKTYIEKEREEPQTKLKKEAPQPHARVGDWKPGDISIEKYFYSGPSKGDR